VPWKLKVQRLFDENDLPNAAMKNKLYQKGKELLLNAGYRDIGMDHFALPTDPLFEARETGSLHRNFMGYTNVNSSVLIGLGVSSISDIGTAYSQNHKEIESYYRSIENGDFPIAKGYKMQPIDQVFKKYILEIICKGKTHFQESHSVWLSHYTMPLLEDLEEDGLITLKENSLEVTKLGFNFLRNICKAFDIKWLSSEESNVKFSKAI
jgi:oxygen-independent coproporphyrinogen-3 oxidase